ncbi:MAG: VIT domain-containing protein [Bacteroidales bacterium]
MKSNQLKSLSLLSANVLVTIVLLLFTGSCLKGQEKTEGDKTLSPYFYVQSDDRGTDRMPLKSTDVTVNIAGVIADVTIKQVYKNEGKNVLEAIYVFPASSRAAVYAMKMMIGEREINAVIQEKNLARQIYQEAKSQGKTASLLEQVRPNVFQMQVANILPGDIIETEMKYTELIIPESAVYRFVFPTVVGPRYSNQTEQQEPEDTWVSNPYLKEGETPNYTFGLKVTINAGMPVSAIKCVSHEIGVDYLDKSRVNITLKDTEAFQGNRDFILQYKLSGNKIHTGVLLFEDVDENYFLAMVQPPQAVTADMLPPREYIFIVDVSGSMYGFPLDVSKALMKNLLHGLKSTDRFNVLLFAGSSEVLFQKSVTASPVNIKNAIDLIDKQQGGGGTELLPALKRALALEGGESSSRTVVIVTDGYISVEKEAFDLIRDNLGKANFFSFGIGSSVNRYLIEGMSHVGNGEPFVITSEKDAGKTAERFRKYISSPVLTNIKIAFQGFDAYDIQPSSYPDVFAEKPLIVAGKYKGDAGGTIKITGLSAGSDFSSLISVNSFKPLPGNSSLKYLWAREKIRLLDDYTQVDKNSELESQITSLGLKYNLLTNYTSFIAVDTEIRNDGRNIITVKQPLPLPQGVSNYAVGASPARYAKTTSSKMNAEEAELDLHDMEYKSGTSGIAMPEEVLFVAEEMPLYPGGINEFVRFIRENFKLPAGSTAPASKVLIEFYVDTNGSLKDIRVITQVEQKIREELIRVIKTCSKWSPGKQNGKTVKVKMVVPVVLI